MSTLILTVIGDDRPGLVSALSAPIEARGASWQRSQLAHLDGKFAGIVVVSVPRSAVDALVTDLGALDGLHVVVEHGEPPTAPASQRLRLELLGDDQPGIVAEISAALAEHDVSIEDLATDVRDAPMSGGVLFEARAVLVAPATSSAEELRSMLEGLGNDLMVEITLTDA